MKRYLTGIDWVINALEYTSRKKTGIGNTSQVVLELDGFLSEKALSERLNIIAQKYPLLFGSLGRAINLCPYWKNGPKQANLRLNVFHLNPESDRIDLVKIFAQELNKPFRDKNEHLIFNLVYLGKKSYLGMLFDHRLMEARGAEAFLGLLGDNSKDVLKEPVPEPSHLDGWLDKFRSGRKLNRAFLNLTDGRPRSLEPDNLNLGSEFKILSFGKEKALKISQDAFSQAGYLMLMPYILSKSIVILHQIFEGRKTGGKDYLIPVSIDTRPNDLLREEVFFNHLSFFLFKIRAQEAGSFQTVLNSIKEQIYNQVKIGLPQAIKEASFLMRIAPLPLVNFFMRVMSKGNPASFSFAFIGDGAYGKNNFMQLPVNNILHLPRVPSPPGLGIFFNQCQGSLNAVFSYSRGLLSEDEISKVQVEINAFI